MYVGGISARTVQGTIDSLAETARAGGEPTANWGPTASDWYA